MTLFETTARTYCITESDDGKHFMIGYTHMGTILSMNQPKEGDRLEVKYTATGSEDDWEKHVSSPIVKITSSADIL